MPAPLVFQDHQFDVIDRNGQPWLRLPQIEGALGYGNRGRGLYNLYKSHADEFTDSMTAVISLPTAGGPQETRIFSLRGCHLLAMFARTPVAKAFRHWVLNILEARGPLSASSCERPNFSHIQVPATAGRDTLRRLISAWADLAAISRSQARFAVRQKCGVERMDFLEPEQVTVAIAFVLEQIDSLSDNLRLPPASFSAFSRRELECALCSLNGALKNTQRDFSTLQGGKA